MTTSCILSINCVKSCVFPAICDSAKFYLNRDVCIYINCQGDVQSWHLILKPLCSLSVMTQIQCWLSSAHLMGFFKTGYYKPRVFLFFVNVNSFFFFFILLEIQYSYLCDLTEIRFLLSLFCNLSSGLSKLHVLLLQVHVLNTTVYAL